MDLPALKKAISISGQFSQKSGPLMWGSQCWLMVSHWCYWSLWCIPPAPATTLSDRFQSLTLAIKVLALTT